METALFTVGQPGQLIAGRYRLERVLARGGHGVVFVAEQLATDARVALKILSPALLDSDETRRRFELEAKVAGRVGSDFIVRVLDAGVDPSTGLAFLAMELLQGESLAQTVEKNGPLSHLEVGTCILQVAQGLDKAHGHMTRDGEAAPIVHRDLKPENLFLTQRDDGERITKILDFGIAKVVRQWGANSRTIQGSPLYVAHEQLTGGAVSPRTDVWALGLVAFFLLTGRSYWLSAQHPELDVTAVLSEVVHMPLIAPSARAVELGIEATWSAAFDDWFLRCVQRTPHERFASAGEAAEALFQALMGDGAVSPPEAVAGLPSRARTPRLLLPAAAGVALTISAAIIGLPWDAVATSNAEPMRARGVAAMASTADALTRRGVGAAGAAPTAAATKVPAVVVPVSRGEAEAPQPRGSRSPTQSRTLAPHAGTPAPAPAGVQKRRPVDWVMSSPLYGDR